MTTVNDVREYLESIAPIELKMDFDNVGLLVGRSGADAGSILVSLDITGEVIAEAREMGAGLIVAHHPLFFSVKTVTDGDVTGGRILALAESGIAAICMHTNLDAAPGGVCETLAGAIGITCMALLREEGRTADGEGISYGRYGFLSAPVPFREYLPTLRQTLRSNGLRYHDAGRDVHKVAVVCGSGGDYLPDAVQQGCDTFVTADIKYDVFLEAKELGINIIDADHFCTENVVTPVLADRLRERFPEAVVRISEKHGQIINFCSL